MMLSVAIGLVAFRDGAGYGAAAVTRNEEMP
jgi:uncharacterized protein (DUF934 family)